jgi:hypothetical protein
VRARRGQELVGAEWAGGSFSLLSLERGGGAGGVAITCRFRGAAGHERGGRWRPGGVTWLRRVEQPGGRATALVRLSDLL